MCAFASYVIALKGTYAELRDGLRCIIDTIGDQGNFLSELIARYNLDEIDENNPAATEEQIEIRNARHCVWIEDLEKLAIDIAMAVPAMWFSIKGHIKDTSDGAGDEMDFLIFHQAGKLFLQSTDWYLYIHMDDFQDYASFSAKVCDLYGNPRFSDIHTSLVGTTS